MTDAGRPPAVAGEFYAGTESPLRDQLADVFDDEYGPGPLESTANDGDVAGIVSPHAGYPFSGPVAAHGFAALAGRETPDAVVVFGPNHGRAGATVAVAPHDRWRTPLGSMPVDREFAEAVVEESAAATFDRRAHEGEHSIEVQLPFLQYAVGNVPVVPVCLTRAGHDRAVALGEAVAEAAAGLGRDVAVVSSTDLTHYEPHERAVEADDPVVDSVASFDDGAVARAKSEGHTMCGPWATVAGMTATRAFGAAEGERLQYATSGQTGGSDRRVVGYASLAWR
ncbi:MAG: AmmeMemoRadiSam system protein B [Halobacteriales archaeon]